MTATQTLCPPEYTQLLLPEVWQCALSVQPLFGDAPCSHGQILAMHMNRTALFGAIFLYAALLLKPGADLCAHTRTMTAELGVINT